MKSKNPINGHQIGVWISEEVKFKQKLWKKSTNSSSKKYLPHFNQFDPCINDGSPEAILQQNLYEFRNHTTISGVLHILTRKRWAWRIFWLLVSLLGLAMSFYQSQDVLADYFGGKTIQIIRYNNAGRVPFPSLTVCSNIRLQYKKATDELTQLLCPNAKTIFSCSRTNRSTRAFGQEVKEDQKLLQTLIEYQLHIPVAERREAFYGKRSRFLYQCSWKGVRCNYNDSQEIYFFSTLLHGQCFTFNMGVNFSQMGRESREFIAVLNMDRLSRKLKFNDMVANFWVHPPGTSPNLHTDNAGRIFPGDKTRIDFSMVKYRNLINQTSK
ncbi:hypothetical protein CHUAL_002240 [Chamberlinius hualienensis]